MDYGNIVLVRNGNNFSVFVDGVADINSNHILDDNDVTDNTNIIIGKANVIEQEFLNAKINNLIIFNKPLSADNIETLQLCLPSGNEEGLVGYWDFNEGSGDTVYDISGNGNHGTIYGATYSEDVPENNCNESDDDINNASYEIGDFVEGGIVFYVDESGERGLVAAMEDLPGTYEWGCYGQTVIGADLSFIGSGVVNSQDIVNDCNGYYVDETAAEAALSYTYASYNDYYLPSIDELLAMYENIRNSSFTSDNQSLYWSSTENVNQNLMVIT